MLTIQEIKKFIDYDSNSKKKRAAKTGQKYYEGEHAIKDYRIFYYDSEGNLTEDKTRSNVRICHPFFTELVDQAVQYILSSDDGIIRSDNPELQAKLNDYFNDNENFMAELTEVLTGSQAKGFDYMYAYKKNDNANGKTSFQWADSLGVIEVKAKDASDNKDHIIYYYTDTKLIGSEYQEITRIQDWDDELTAYYSQIGNGAIVLDVDEDINPRPHIIYNKPGDNSIYYDSYGFIPFFRFDNNKKQISSLKPVKDLIDDYDLMASSLSNNLVDFDTPIHVVKGFEGDNLDQLQQNLKTKKLIGVNEDGGVEVHTVDVPYEARKVKLELDEKNIYRFGMGLNTAGLKDTNATTNIAIKAAYSLLDLKCAKIEIKLKQFLRKIIKIVLDEVNTLNETDYQMKEVYFKFDHEIMSNAQENAQIELTEAQKQQIVINTLLNLATKLDDNTLMQLICEQLDIDYNDIKNKLPKEDDEAYKSIQDALDSIVVEGGGSGEQGTEGSSADIS